MSSENKYRLQIIVEDTALAHVCQQDLDVCRNVWCFSPLFLKLADGVVGLGSVSEPRQGLVFVDFTGGTMAHRRQFGGGKKSEAVARACFGNMNAPVIFDATAGLGRDAFVNAYLGATVHLFERNPVVRLLLKNGLERAAKIGDPEIYQERMIMENVPDIASYTGPVIPDTVYLDPMYPERQKSALVKKEMRTFHDLIGIDDDRYELLTAARKLASRRVVMKNPKWAEVLDEKGKVAEVVTKNHRFDIYSPVRSSEQ